MVRPHGHHPEPDRIVLIFSKTAPSFCILPVQSPSTSQFPELCCLPYPYEHTFTKKKKKGAYSLCFLDLQLLHLVYHQQSPRFHPQPHKSSEKKIKSKVKNFKYHHLCYPIQSTALLLFVVIVIFFILGLM